MVQEIFRKRELISVLFVAIPTVSTSMKLNISSVLLKILLKISLSPEEF